MSKPLPQGIVTFLMTDVVGSSALAERDPAGYLVRLAEHDRLWTKHVEANSGILLKQRGEGDSTFSVFIDPAHALAATEALLADSEFLAADLTLRIAIHTGSAELVGNDYRGDTINRCGRIRGLAHPGQVLLSESVKDLIGIHLVNKRFTLKSLGRHVLKDLQREVELYQLEVGGQSREFPPVASLKAYRNNLTAELTPFVGREREMGEIRQLISRSRLVSILGPGGVGKTRIAQHLAAEVIEEFPDGVWFVELATTSDVNWLGQLLASVGLNQSGFKTAKESVLAQLAEWKALIILDNCEQMGDDFARELRELLTHTSRLVVLVTTQVVLDLPEETVFRLPPLGHSAGIDEALELFLIRARDKVGAEIVGNLDMVECRELIKAVEGMPLAIELIAPRLRTYSIRQILQRLNQVLTSQQSHSKEARHSSVRASFEYSYSLLSPVEQSFLRRLATIPDGFSLDMAEEWYGSDATGAESAAELLIRIVDRSFVDVYLRDGAFRYRILPYVRTFLSELIESKEERFECESALIQWADFTCRDHLTRGDFGPTFSVEAANITEGLRLAIERPLAVSAIGIARAIRKLWIADGDSRIGESFYRRVLELAPTQGIDAEADAHNAYGIFLWFGGKLDEAQSQFARAVELWESIGSHGRVAAALNNMGGIAMSREEYEEAKAAWEKAMKLFRQAGQIEHERTCRANLATVELHVDYESCKDIAYEMMRDVDYFEHHSLLLSNIFGRSVHESDWAMARRLLPSVVESFTDFDPVLRARTSLHLAYLLNVEGRNDLAGALMESFYQALERGGIEPTMTDRRVLDRISKSVGRSEMGVPEVLATLAAELDLEYPKRLVRAVVEAEVDKTPH